MFLELEQGVGGLVRISPEPMRQEVKTLEAEPSNKMHLSATSRHLTADASACCVL
jgi:hypothetical protein